MSKKFLLVLLLSFVTIASTSLFKEDSEQLKQKIMWSSLTFPQLYRCINDPAYQKSIKKLSQSNEDTWLDEHIFSKLPPSELHGGTFVEIGALDGLKYSNTFYFERKYDWRGLLIEGSPVNQRALRLNAQERSNCALFSTAICELPSDGTMGHITFMAQGGATGAAVNHTSKLFLDEWHKGHEHGAKLDVRCVPIQPIFELTGVVDIDLFSLDVEGAELFVLNTVDFNVTNFRVIVVESNVLDQEKDEKVRKLLESHGYIDAKVVSGLGDMHAACNPMECTSNDVYVNPHFQARKDHRRAGLRFNRYFHADTGLPCQPFKH